MMNLSLIGWLLLTSLVGTPAFERDRHPSRPRGGVSGMLPEHFAGGLERQLDPFVLPKQDLGVVHTYDVLFLADARPVKIRLHIDRLQSSIEQVWQKRIRQWFDYFDRDHSGHLNAHELRFVYSARGVDQLLQGQFYYRAAIESVPLAELDRDQDRRVSFAELIAYYAPAAQHLVRIRPGLPSGQNADQITEAMFALLDSNQDEKLAAEELNRTQTLLADRDADDNEILTVRELTDQAARRTNAMMATPGMMGRTTPENEPERPRESLLEVAPAKALPKELTQTLLQKYDQNQDAQLDPNEFALPSSVFRHFDRDHSQRLCVEELADWRQTGVDVCVELRLGDASTPPLIRCTTPPSDLARGPIPLTLQPLDDMLTVHLAGQSVAFHVGYERSVDGQSKPLAANLGRRYAGIFGMADSNHDKQLTDAEIAGPQFQFLRIVFDGADHDANGRLSQQEFQQYFRVHQQISELPLALTFATQKPSLFDLLDRNGDARLGLRELRTLSSRVRTLTPDGGPLTRAAIRPRGLVELGSARGEVPASVGGPFDPRTPDAPKEQTQGPVWFRKLDRNADGDVSPREWLMSRPLFNRIDADGDGLISLKEAEAVGSP